MKASRLTLVFGISMIGLVTLALVTQPKHRQLKSAQPEFKVLESDALFFRNLRQFYYEREEREDADYEFFRHPDQSQFEDYSPRLAIVNNWLHDEAYLLFEGKTKEPFSQILRIQKGNEWSEYPLNGSNVETQQRIAIDIYESLGKEEVHYSIRANDENILIWNNSAKRGLIKTILQDYFKLTGRL